MSPSGTDGDAGGMRYVSTRGQSEPRDFSAVVVDGLADDGGLYVPGGWPTPPPVPASASYRERAVALMAPFAAGSLDAGELAGLVEAAWASFGVDEVVSVRELDDGLHLAELWHGPTLAFKDIALGLLGRLLDAELAARDTAVCVLGATSGDTGSAAIEALAGVAGCEVVILHPHGRVSDVQRRQMTTVDAPNVHNLAVAGTFDDCQALVKAILGDEDARGRYGLVAVNSINWARILAQAVYYAHLGARLGGPGAPVHVAVPSGNFGNAYASWVARRCGASLGVTVVASNANDALARFFATGTVAVPEVVPTLSPSMDIAVPSNLERLVFELLDRDGAAVSGFLEELRAAGRATIAPERMDRLAGTWAAVEGVDDAATAATMADTYSRHGLLIDPHTAVGLTAARRWRATGAGADAPLVVLSTAHPAKFPDAVEGACGVRPALPARLADLHERPERYQVVAADEAAVRAVLDAVAPSRRR